jgi:hypothetical protein
MQASSPAVSTLLSSLRIYQARSRYAACQRALLAGRSRFGLANVVGSLAAGWGAGRYLRKNIMTGMYASHTVLILIYLPAPKTALTFYLFASGLGVT